MSGVPKIFCRKLGDFVRVSSQKRFGEHNSGTVVLPICIKSKIESLLCEHDKKLLRVDSIRLFEALRSTSFIKKGIENAEKPTPVQVSQRAVPISKKNAKDSDQKIKTVYLAPHVVEYGARETAVYLATRLPVSYSILSVILSEIKRRCPDFEPKSVYDFGCGAGIASWVVDEIWKGQLQHVHCTDVSLTMLNAAERFLEDTKCQKVFTQYLAHNPEKDEKHDVVVAAFVLEELPNQTTLTSTIETLWEKTQDILVLVERGTPGGHSIIQKARTALLDIIRKSNQESHIVAPCPHEKECPLASKKTWCHFKQRVQRTDVMMKTKHAKVNYEDNSYSYIVFRKKKRPSLEIESENAISTESFNWSRLISPTIRPKKQVVMDLCSPEGVIKRYTITKSLSDSIYRDAKKASWGDLWPHQQEKGQEVRGLKKMNSDTTKK